MRVLLLTTLLGKKLILTMFQPDALVRLPWGGLEHLCMVRLLPSEAVRKRTLIINFHAYTGATEESVQLLSCPTGLDLV